MTERLRWGILATGGIARLFTNDLKLNGFTVQAVGSRSQQSADAFAAEFGIPTAHGSYEALVADPEVDVIYVSTPHPLHVSNAMLALEAGKHVLIEKPFAVNSREAQAIADLASAKGLLVLEAMWTRYLPHMTRIREVIAAGTLGEVRTMIADHTQLLSDDPAHRINALELGGGALLDLGIYPISFAWDLFGAPSSIQAHATLTDAGVDRETAIILAYPSGAHAVMHTQMSGTGPNRAAIVGKKGRIEIESVWYNVVGFTRYDDENNVVERFDEKVGGRGMHFQA